MSFLGLLGNFGSMGGLMNIASAGLNVSQALGSKGSNNKAPETMTKEDLSSTIDSYMAEMKEKYASLGIEFPNFDQMMGNEYFLSQEEQDDMLAAAQEFSTKKSAYQTAMQNQMSRYKEDLETAKSDVFKEYHYEFDSEGNAILDSDGYPKCFEGKETDEQSEMRSHWEVKRKRAAEDAQVADMEDGEIEALSDENKEVGPFTAVMNDLSSNYSELNKLMEDPDATIEVNGEQCNMERIMKEYQRESTISQLEQEVDELKETMPSVLKGLVDGNPAHFGQAEGVMSDWTRELFSAYDNWGVVENGMSAYDECERRTEETYNASAYKGYQDKIKNNVQSLKDKLQDAISNMSDWQLDGYAMEYSL
ncbi:hypothetical protein IJT93_03105 [bacterium]|nr:hypothetical protein [bacterium]